jgi:putative ABC transport system permease protein
MRLEQNSLTLFFRRIRRRPLTSGILIGGLVLSITSCLLIAFFVTGELSVDRFQQKIDRIVLLTQFENSISTGGKLGTDIKSKYPQVEEMARLRQDNLLVTADGEGAYEADFYFADASVFRVFSFTIVEGYLNNALQRADGVVITASTAAKYFSRKNAVGKELIVNGKHHYTVQAVVKDFPVQSHIHPTIFASYKSANQVAGYDVNSNYWGGGTNTYFLLKPNANRDQLQRLLPDYIKSLNDPNAGAVWKLQLVPLKDLYLRTSLIGTSPISYVYIFTAAGLLILLLSGFNYINLSTALAGIRRREVGIKKLLGTSISALRRIFIYEAAYTILISLCIALLLCWLLLPWFNQLAGWKLSFGTLFHYKFLLASAGLLVFFILLSGLYPAWLLSGGTPIVLLKGNKTLGNPRYSFRSLLVVIQFGISIIMIVATVAVYYQLDYIQTKNLGYNREQLITLDLRDADQNNKQLFKQRVLEITGVQSATIAFSLPGSGSFQGQKLVKEFVPQGSTDASISRITFDQDYLKTFGIQLLQGRMLDENRPADKEKFLVNQAAMQFFQWKNIVGKRTGYYRFEYQANGSYAEIPVNGEVVGVVANYNHADLKSVIQPTIYSLNDGWEAKMSIRIKAGSTPLVIKAIEKTWKAIFAGKPYNYTFLDDSFNKTYQAELRTGRIFSGFALIAILISCLGIFGLVSFSVQQRIKEIGIRKILGASVRSLVNLISKEFFALAVLGAAIGLPIAWYGIRVWLENYAYHIQLKWWLLGLPALLLMSLVAITIIGNVIQSALANPVKQLRSD